MLFSFVVHYSLRTQKFLLVIKYDRIAQKIKTVITVNIVKNIVVRTTILLHCDNERSVKTEMFSTIKIQRCV